MSVLSAIIDRTVHAVAHRKVKNLRGYHDVPASELLYRKSDGLHLFTEGSLLLVSMSFRFLGLDVAMMTGFLIANPNVAL